MSASNVAGVQDTTSKNLGFLWGLLCLLGHIAGSACWRRANIAPVPDRYLADSCYLYYNTTYTIRPHLTFLISCRLWPRVRLS